MLKGMIGSEPGIGKDGMKRGKLNSNSTKKQTITFQDVAGIDGARKELGVYYYYRL